MRHLRRHYRLQLSGNSAGRTLRYFAAFVPGTRGIIEAALRERLADVSLVKLLDGAVIFETAATYDRLNFFCFNNIFALVDILETKPGGEPGRGSGAASLELHIRKILAAPHGQSVMQSAMGGNNKKIRSFRLICSVENKPVSIDENLKRNAERFIGRASGLTVNRSAPDTEFWFLYRSEGFSCFMKRLTNHRAGEKSLHAGELSPQLAWMLCRAAGLEHGETALDPFCGYGAIPLAACKHFPIKKMYAFDVNPRCVKITGSKPGLKDSARLEAGTADFRSLSKIVLEKFDAIVTDPPWGVFESDIPLEKFYAEIIEVFSGLLADNGRVVILTAALTELEAAVEKSRLFQIAEKIPILVSGKKATIFLLNFNQV